MASSRPSGSTSIASRQATPSGLLPLRSVTVSDSPGTAASSASSASVSRVSASHGVSRLSSAKRRRLPGEMPDHVADAHLVRRDAEHRPDAGEHVLGGGCAIEADEVAASVEAARRSACRAAPRGRPCSCRCRPDRAPASAPPRGAHRPKSRPHARARCSAPAWAAAPRRPVAARPWQVCSIPAAAPGHAGTAPDPRASRRTAAGRSALRADAAAPVPRALARRQRRKWRYSEPARMGRDQASSAPRLGSPKPAPQPMNTSVCLRRSDRRTVCAWASPSTAS